MRIDLSLPPEMVSRLRIASLEKYGNMRSMSRLVEDLLAAGMQQPDDPKAAVESSNDPKIAIDPNTERPYISRVEFNRVVRAALNRIKDLKTSENFDAVTWFFILKEAHEQAQNHIANEVNVCYRCCFLNEPLPTYPVCDNFTNMDNLRNKTLFVGAGELE